MLMHALYRSAILLLLLTATGCIYSNVHTPLSYRSPTPGDVPGPLGPEVTGEACNHVVLWLVAWGDGGYSAAVGDAKRDSGARMLVDVEADTKLFNILGVYQQSCTRVRGKTVM
jgi:TRL-like protein family